MVHKRNSRGRFAAHTPSKNTLVNPKAMDVRKESQIPELERMISLSPSVTFILIYADWCGHCHRYLPMWKNLEKTPGRTANMASVHHDMVDKSPIIANAKIQGYPSVIKVEPNGKIEEFESEEGSTNAIPNMRNTEEMQQELRQPVSPLRNTVPENVMKTANDVIGMPSTIPVSAVVTKPETIQPVLPEPPKDKGVPGIQAGMVGDANLTRKNLLVAQTGGMRGGAIESVLGAFLGAVQSAGPAALLLMAHSALLKRNLKQSKTYKSPKKASRVASTRRRRRS